MTTKVGILDYGCGNIGSVAQAFDYIGAAPVIIRSGNEASAHDFSHLVLPGVGTFEKASTGLRDRHLDGLIQSHLQKSRPFLGICVGMQVMMREGHEYGTHPGLALFDGVTDSLKGLDDSVSCPNIGWDHVNFSPKSAFAALNDNEAFFYFNHSYVCRPQDPAMIGATRADSRSDWPVLIEKDNLFGIQCHPEKSHSAGLAFLNRFMELS